MAFFKKKISAEEFGEGLWIQISEFTKKFYKTHFEDDSLKPTEATHSSFLVEALVLHLWIVSKALGNKHKESLDVVHDKFARMSSELGISDSSSLLHSRYKEYYEVFDAGHLELLGSLIYKNVYGLEKQNGLASLGIDGSPASITHPLLFVKWMTMVMEVMSNTINKFNITE